MTFGLTKAGTPRKRPTRPGEGRPTKYDPSMCEEVVRAALEGLTLTGFAGKIGVSRDTIDEWMRNFPEFSEATARAKAIRAYSWEIKAIKVGDRGGGPGTAQIIQFALKNLAPEEWKDKSETEHSGGLSIQIGKEFSGL